MNYSKIYNDFIEDRRKKESQLIESGIYRESHHILPRALGGGDDPENLISLTAEDHYFAHLLLAHIYGGTMWQAVKMMRWGRVTGERKWLHGRHMYGVARRKSAEALSDLFSGQEGMRGDENGRYDSEAHVWTNVDTGETVEATKWEMWDRHGGCRAHWTSVTTGERKTMLGWTTRPDEVRIRSGKGKTFNFVNRDGRVFTGRQIEFARQEGLSAASVSRVTRKGDVTLCGWRLYGTPDRLPTQARAGGFAWQYRKAENARIA